MLSEYMWNGAMPMLNLRRLNALGNTALGMSFIRGKESLREDALFYDKLAVEIFKIKDERNNTEKSSDDSYIIVRTKFFDDTVSRILKNADMEQVVVLGVGLDVRFQRLNFNHKLKVFEIDQLEVIEFRQEIIPQLNFKTDSAFIQIGHTLSNEKSIIKVLTENNFDRTKKTLWILEGLLYYLRKAEVETLMEEISELSSDGSKILCDAINSAFLESGFTQPWITQMRKEGKGWYFGIDNYDDFFQQFGWKIKLTQPGEDNANYGRWRYKVFPVSLNHIPRYFFIEAIK